jgi:asparagine synthase (glutamine-hydrolysing)
MCGFLTYIKSDECDFPNFNSSKNTLKRRGPDFQDDFIQENFYAFHSRLSIIDLDSRSNQPFLSSCNRFVIVYNGEIYNFKELAEYLKSQGVSLRTTSDTEVILNLYLIDGENMLQKLRGMFSFFIWDLEFKKGFVARDPYGIKPLYFFASQDKLIFSSQFKAIANCNMCERIINQKAKADFHLLGSITEDNTFFEGINCFKSGFKMIIDGNRIIDYSIWANTKFYFFSQESSNSTINDFHSLKISTHKFLLDSIQNHVVSDVKVGLFLSSGIDSATLASLLKEIDTTNVKGITVVFDDDINNESIGAQKLAEIYGIELYIKRVSKEEFYQDMDLIFESMDQPSIDGINTWYASKAASECGIKVVLSGVGADELFQGYTYYSNYPYFMYLFRFIKKSLPFKLTIRLISNLFYSFTKKPKWKYIDKWLSNYGGAWLLQRSFMTPAEIGLTDFKSDIESVEKNITMGKDISDYSRCSPIEILSYFDNEYYLKNQLLRDSDWASMYHGVELRTPFVDYSLLTSISSLFPFFKNYPKKKLMYDNLKYSLPDFVINKKKTGFSTSIKTWVYEKYGVKTNNDFSNFIFSNYLSSLNK